MSNSINYPDLGSPDFATVQRFFNHFQYAKQTCVFIPKATGKTDKKTDRKVITNVFDNTRSLHATATALNLAMYDVYFMVNEGDGVTIPEGNTTVRNKAAVVNLHNCFYDLDGCALVDVVEFLAAHDIEPHLIVESSPNRYHVYIHLEPTPVDQKSIMWWQSVQTALYLLGNPEDVKPGIDANAMRDYSRLLRVAGYTHIEKRSVVSIHGESDHAPYTLEFLYKTLCKNSYSITNYQALNNGMVVDLGGTTIYGKGERNDALCSASMQIAYQESDSAAALERYTNFARTRIDNSDGEFVKDGKITVKCRQILISALSKVSASKRETISSAKQLPVAPTHRFVLPDEFYFSAPSGLGDIVKQMCKNSRYASAPIAFGIALTALSTIRSLKYLTPEGGSPSLYTLIAAETGFGKSDNQSIITRTFQLSGIGKHVFKRIRSDQGLLNQLSYSNNVACFLCDEAFALINSLQDPKSSGHIQRIGTELLDLYSIGSHPEHRSGRVAGTGKTKGEQEIVLRYPALSMCGLMPTHCFEKLITREAIDKGFVPRLITIFEPKRKRVANDDAVVNYVIDHPLFREFEQSAVEITDTAVQPIMSRVPVPMDYESSAAKLYFKQLRNRIDNRINDLPKEHEMLGNILTRCAENTLRVAATLSPNGAVTSEALNFADKFVSSRTEALISFVLARVVNAKTPAQQTMIEAAETLCAKNKDGSNHITHRELMRTAKIYGDAFRNTISDLSALGILERKDMVNNDPEKQRARRITAYLYHKESEDSF